MTRTTIKPSNKILPDSETSRFATMDSRSARMQMRLTELDILHDLEISRIERLIDTTKKQFNSFNAEREG